MSYIVNLAKSLTDLRFSIIEGMCDSHNITEFSKYLLFGRQEGHIFYGISVINCDSGCDYKTITELIKKSVDGLKSNKIIVNIYLSSSPNDELMEYIQNDIEDYNAEMISLKWLVDTENENIIVKGSQPNDILGIRQAMINAFESDEKISINSYELKQQEKAKDESLVKTAKCNATYVFMVLNFVFWIIMYTQWGENIVNSMSLDKSMVSEGQVYRLFTYMFTHGGIEHFVCNTFTLFIIGARLEKYSGSFKFSLLYILSGIIAGCTSYLVEPYGVAVGASGAIFGIIGGLIYMIRKIKHNIGGLDYSVAVVFAIIGVFSGFFVPNIDNFAHIGGLISGVILASILRLEK